MIHTLCQSARRLPLRRLLRPMIVLALLFSAVMAGHWGVRLRRYVYETTEPIRFQLDVRNAYTWGRHATENGLFDLYNRVLRPPALSAPVGLDYLPLRLTAATLWYQWTQRHFPDEVDWQPKYEFTAPMLWGNTIAALLSSVLVFLLVRMWIIRMDDAQRNPVEPARPFRGVIAGLFGALWLWFNPTVLWNGYAWVQWDIWPVPFYLGAVYLACRDWWLPAGICLAIGPLFKGQMLLAMPILFIWPLFQLRFGALLRLCAGMAIGTALIVFPWMTVSRSALAWYLCAIAAIAAIVPVALRVRMNRWIVIGLALAAMALAWPWSADAPLQWKLLATGAVAIVALSRYLPARLVPAVYALAVAGLIFATIPLYHAGTAWYGRLEFGMNRDIPLHAICTNNLCGFLERSLHWPNDALAIVDAWWIGPVSMQTLMGIIYGIFLVLCGIGAAIQDRRRDTRFLIAMFLPWLLFFLLLTQMRGRYLIWASAMSALLFGAGQGLWLLGVLVTGVGLLQMMQNQHLLNQAHYRLPLPDWIATANALEPHLAWPLMLIAGICLYMALAPRARPAPRTTPNPL